MARYQRRKWVNDRGRKGEGRMRKLARDVRGKNEESEDADDDDDDDEGMETADMFWGGEGKKDDKDDDEGMGGRMQVEIKDGMGIYLE